MQRMQPETDALYETDIIIIDTTDALNTFTELTVGALKLMKRT